MGCAGSGDVENRDDRSSMPCRLHTASLFPGLVIVPRYVDLISHASRKPLRSIRAKSCDSILLYRHLRAFNVPSILRLALSSHPPRKCGFRLLLRPRSVVHYPSMHRYWSITAGNPTSYSAIEVVTITRQSFVAWNIFDGDLSLHDSLKCTKQKFTPGCHSLGVSVPVEKGTKACTPALQRTSSWDPETPVMQPTSLSFGLARGPAPSHQHLAREASM